MVARVEYGCAGGPWGDTTCSMDGDRELGGPICFSKRDLASWERGVWGPSSLNGYGKINQRRQKVTYSSAGFSSCFATSFIGDSAVGTGRPLFCHSGGEAGERVCSTVWESGFSAVFGTYTCPGSFWAALFPAAYREKRKQDIFFP